MTSDNAETKRNPDLNYTAPPPRAAVALVLAMLAVFIPTLPTLESLDQVAKTSTFTDCLFPELISVRVLAWIRTMMAMGMWLLQLKTVLVGPGWMQTTNYLPSSKLNSSPMPIYGIRTMALFTSWTWNLLTLSFTVNSIITHLAIQEKPVSIWLLRSGIVLFEIAAPMTLLVSLVVRYKIWPNILRNGGDTNELKKFRTLLWHNANVVLSMSQVGLFGKLPVRFGDFSLAPLFGIVYIMFTWQTRMYWSPNDGPQFLYYFMDTTLGDGFVCKVLLALLVVLTFFYVLFVLAEFAFEYLGHVIGGDPIVGVVVHCMLIFLVCCGVCKFRD